jgi:hypothetical protein
VTFVTRNITRAAAAIELGLQDKLYLGNLDASRGRRLSATGVKFVFDTSRLDGSPQKLPDISELASWLGGKIPLREGIATAYANFLAGGGERAPARVKTDA